MLASHWIIIFFKKGYSEVRILFDQVDSQGISSKLIERNRRDGEPQTEYEPYDAIHNNTKLPRTKWITFLKNIQNKRLLCNYLSNRFVDVVQAWLNTSEHRFVTAGGLVLNSEFSEFFLILPWVRNHIIYIITMTESDTQIWLHVQDSVCSTIHVYSVDRDRAMI